MSKVLVILTSVCAIIFSTSSEVNAQTVNQTDNFQNGTTLSWTSGTNNSTQPTNISTGGPNGSNDKYLRMSSSGGIGAGSKLVFFNKTQWTGNYLTAGITYISMNMKNEGSNALVMRIALFGSAGNCVSAPVSLPVGSGWITAVFSLAQNNMTVSGTYSAILGSITELRILHSNSASTQGDVVAAQIGVDNITAAISPVPVPRDSIPPNIPLNLIVTDSSSKTISIQWRKNTDADFLRYRIYRGTSPNPATKTDSTIGGVTDTSKTFTNLTNGIRYYVRITAVDSTGNESGYSNEVNAAPSDRTAPAAPQNLIVTDSSSKTISIQWRKNTDADFLRYRIYGGTSPNPFAKVDSTSGGITDTVRIFMSLTNGIRYFFRVTAIDSTGNESGFSNEVNAVPGDRIAPSAPQSLIITDSSSTKIGITWRKNTETDFLRYRIYRNISPNPLTKMDSTTGGSADTAKLFIGLTNGVRYYIRVKAVDSTGNESSFSNEMNAAPGSFTTVNFNVRKIIFGAVNLGQFKDTIITITNTGNDNLHISNIASVDTIFSARVKILNIAAGDSAKDALTFKPAVLNIVSGKLIVTSNSLSSPDTIFVSGSGLPTTGVNDLRNLIPTIYELEQNYPNPFNPSTQIKYQLPQRGFVTLRIYDMLGQEIVTLVNEEINAGTYIVNWNASRLSSGMYLVKMTSGSFSSTKKLLLVK